MIALFLSVRHDGESIGTVIGNVLGSNLLNVLLVLGVTALVKPIAVGESTRKIEIPFLIFISAIFLILSYWGILTQ